MNYIKQIYNSIAANVLKDNKLVIFFIWMIATFLNVTKAYHIDDTFHLEAANWIKENPLTPMSGLIIWDHSPIPIHNFNQPPLFFYMLALGIKILGDGEIFMHLILSFFTFLCLYYYNKLLFFLNAENKTSLILLFGFCPAFFVNQNLMTDIPLLSATLAMMFYLMRGIRDNTLPDYIRSACFLSLGLFIKYSLLPLLVVLILIAIIHKKYYLLAAGAIPILSLFLWSMWNQWEYGSIHLLDRPKSIFKIEKFSSFAGTLGSMIFFVPILIHHLLPFKYIKHVILFSFILLFSTIPIVYLGMWNEDSFNNYLNQFFIYSGGFVLILFLTHLIFNVFKYKSVYIKSYAFIISIYIFGSSLFMILFAPFFATRHLLLIIPFLLLLLDKYLKKTNGLINKTVIFISIVTTLLLSISDWLYADFYRTSAFKIHTNDKRIWSAGHWGWQWYSKKAGMLTYTQKTGSLVQKNDLFTYPFTVPKQNFNKNIELIKVGFITNKPNILTFFSCANGASMYHSSYKKPAWSLSKKPFDTVFICKVQKIKTGK